MPDAGADDEPHEHSFAFGVADAFAGADTVRGRCDVDAIPQGQGHRVAKLCLRRDEPGQILPGKSARQNRPEPLGRLPRIVRDVSDAGADDEPHEHSFAVGVADAHAGADAMRGRSCMDALLKWQAYRRSDLLLCRDEPDQVVPHEYSRQKRPESPGRLPPKLRTLLKATLAASHGGSSCARERDNKAVGRPHSSLAFWGRVGTQGIANCARA